MDTLVGVSVARIIRHADIRTDIRTYILVVRGYTQLDIHTDILAL